jgi:hypothetical protein
VGGRAPQAGGSRILTPLDASHDPLSESLCSVSLRNRYISSVWTPLSHSDPADPRWEGAVAAARERHGAGVARLDEGRPPFCTAMFVPYRDSPYKREGVA